MTSADPRIELVKNVPFIIMSLISIINFGRALCLDFLLDGKFENIAQSIHGVARVYTG